MLYDFFVKKQKFILLALIALQSSSLLYGRSKPTKSPQNKTQKLEEETDPYWINQKKYLVNPQDFYGQLPAALQVCIAMLQNKNEFAEVGLCRTSNFIFYGPPGTGKTYMASVFAQKIGAEFMYVKGNELLDQWQGAGLRKPAELFERARARRDSKNKPVVMFIDEIDTCIGSRDMSYHEGRMELIGAMLCEIGSEINNNIIVIAATNRLYGLDPAFLRSGRFEHHIEFCLPNAQERKDFLICLIQSQAQIFDDAIDWDLVANRTQGFSPADLKKLIDTLKMNYVLQKINKVPGASGKITYEDICRLLPAMPVRSEVKKSKSLMACLYQYLKSFIE